MRAVFQRVLQSHVEVDSKQVGAIEQGAMVLLGVATEDTEDDCAYLAEKVAGLRVFDDAQGKMNLSVRDVGGRLLVVSQFTLYGDCRRGRRPSFIAAAEPARAQQLYAHFCRLLRDGGLVVEEGIFQAEMKVFILNDGPVTILLDSKRVF